MLVLSRKRDESIIIGDSVVVTIIEIRGGRVRLGIEVPKDTNVFRSEVFDAIRLAEIRRASAGSEASAENASLWSPHPNQPADRVFVQGKSAHPLAVASQLAQLTHSELVTEVGSLRTQLNDLRRRYEENMDALIDAHRELEHSARSVATDDQSSNVRMMERYFGVVRHVDEETVVVTYEVDDDIVEQIYRCDQFLEGRVPKLNDQLSVEVRVVDISRPQEPADLPDFWTDDVGSSLSREF